MMKNVQRAYWKTLIFTLNQSDDWMTISAEDGSNKFKPNSARSAAAPPVVDNASASCL